MKRIGLRTILLGLFLILTFGTVSCQKTDGGCTLPRFESPPVFTKDGGDRIIKAKHNVDWWFNNLIVDDQPISFESGSLTVYYKNRNQPYSIIKIEEEWFTIEKIDNKTISIQLNKTNKARSLSFEAYRGNCTETIYVDQNME